MQIKKHKDELWKQKKKQGFDGDYYFEGKRYRFLFSPADSDFVTLIEVPNVK